MRRKKTPLPPRTIFIRVNHPEYTHAAVSITKYMVRIHFGVTKKLNFETKISETYTIQDHPEIIGLWDGFGWQLEELLIFLRNTSQNYSLIK